MRNQIEYRNEFNKENYSRLNIFVAKDKRDSINEHYKKRGFKSLNSYINALIEEDMKQKNISVGNINQNGDNNTINIG